MNQNLSGNQVKMHWAGQVFLDPFILLGVSFACVFAVHIRVGVEKMSF